MKDLIFEIIGIDKASRTFEKVGAAVEANTHKLTGMQKAGSMAGKALVVGLAGVAAGAFESVKAASEEQVAQQQLAKQLQNSTGATKDQTDAANEWIEKQAEASGIAVDQLDPALAKLATSTGSLSKAQAELSTAMDVSAGSGKSLDQISSTLVKVNNGQAAGLSKLGVQTKTTAKDTEALKAAQIAAKTAQEAVTKAVKDNGPHSSAAALAIDKLHLAQSKLSDAQTKTKTTTVDATTAMAELAKKYSGDAASAAQTNAGKTKVLGVEIHDLEVKIGDGLLPAVEHLTDAGLKMVGWVSKNGPLVEDLAIALGTLLATTWLVSKATAAWSAVSGIAAAASSLFAESTVEVDAAMDANPIGLVTIAIAALIAGLILAYKHSETFRNVVDAMGHGLTKIPPIIGAVVGFVKDHWMLMLTLIGGPTGLLVALIIKHFSAIKAFVTTAISDVVATAKDVGKFATLVGDHIADVVQFFKNLPGKVTNALDALPGQLLSLGGQLIQGLVHGIENGAQTVLNAVTSLVDKIPKKIRQLWGIASPSKVAAGIGGDFMDGLALGITARTSAVEAAAGTAASKVAQAAKAKLSSLLDSKSSLASSVAGAFTGNLYGATATTAVTDDQGNVTTPAQTVGQNFLSGLSSTAGSLGGLKSAFKNLKKWGWKPAMIAQLFQSGGPDLILELGSNSGEASQAQAYLGQISHLSNKLGGQVAGNQYDDEIAAAKGGGKGKGKGKGGAPDGGSGREAAGDTYNLTFNVPANADTNTMAKTTVQMIKKYKREINGGKDLGIA